MTSTRKTIPSPADLPAAVDSAPTDTAPETVTGPPLRPGQEAEHVTFAHHLRIGGIEFRPGDTAYVSPDYSRQLRRSGYIARARA
ncbi:hypothetical protein ABT024_05430 [Streptomyces sp. NPDC002812]|uniref:hypothetical protein n=1 Tax=Streptomyces sp. NPDC002812 TaxID=3154434 RepID=UPI00331C48BF